MTGVSGPTSQPPAGGDIEGIDTTIYDGQIKAWEGQLSTAEANLSNLEARLDRLEEENGDWFGGWPFWGGHLGGEIGDVKNQIKLQKEIIANAQGMLAGFQEAKGDLSAVAEELRKENSSLSKMLKNGDIEGAVMMVQTRRTKELDKQIGARIVELQERNNAIAELNVRLSKLGKDDNKGKTELKGQIDKLNADSQLDMIKMQSLTNKRNQAFDMLTNLLQKFQKSNDAIVSNMR